MPSPKAQPGSQSICRKAGGGPAPAASIKQGHQCGRWLQSLLRLLGHFPVTHPYKTQRHPRASAETETLPWCRHWCWAPPHQLDCFSSSQEKQSLAKVMRWSQAHYVNTVWATFIIPHHEPHFHERGSLAPLDKFNHFWHEDFFSYFMTYFPSII